MIRIAEKSGTYAGFLFSSDLVVVFCSGRRKELLFDLGIRVKAADRSLEFESARRKKGSSCLYREFVDENRKGKEKLEKRKNGEKT